MHKHPLLLLLFVGLVLYAPIFFAGFAGDDLPHFHIVEKNYTGTPLAPFTHVIGTPADNQILGYFYRPLPFTIYTAISSFSSNENALPFHILQVFLYILSAYLFFLFCTRFFSQKIALLLGLIFLIHPANNDLGAYIAALNETLCLFFGLLTLLLIKKSPSLRRLGGLFAAILLCLFSKETGVIFVAIAILYAQYKKTLVHTIPILAAFFFYMFCRIAAAAQPVYSLTQSPTANISGNEHLFLAPQIAFMMLREIIMPTRAGIKPDAFALTWQSSIIPALVVGFVFLAGFALWTFLKKKHTPQASSFGFFYCWALLGIPLHLQFIPLEVIFADRWLYLTEMGILGILGLMLTALLKTKNKWLHVCRILFLLLLCFYAIETFALNMMWLQWEKYFI